MLLPDLPSAAQASRQRFGIRFSLTASQAWLSLSLPHWHCPLWAQPERIATRVLLALPAQPELEVQGPFAWPPRLMQQLQSLQHYCAHPVWRRGSKIAFVAREGLWPWTLLGLLRASWP